MAKLSRPKAIDLFSGCGGLSLGLKKAGFKVVAAVDSDPLSMSTYKHNHPRCLHINKDISEVNPIDLMKQLKLHSGDLDLLAGCPPCQGFSTLRTFNGSREIAEPMNNLIFQFLRFIHVFMPQALMIENVPGLLSDERLKRFVATITNLGYVPKSEVFDASNYGVPQRRKRMILIANLGEEVQFAEPTKRRRTVRGTIGRLPEPGTSSDPAHDYVVNRSTEVEDRIQMIPKDGGSRNALSSDEQLPCHKRMKGFRDVYGRMAWSRQAPTLTTGCINPSKGRFLHPEQNRSITVREAALLQGFPRNYYIDMSQGPYSAARMVGNAFPPRLAMLHAAALLSQISGKFETKS